MAQAAGQRPLEGIVIGVRDLGESDRVVELLTAAEGRVSLLARGGRASRRRFAGALDLFTTLQVQVIPRGNLWTLHAADVVDARLGLRRTLEAIERASTLVECASLLTAEHQEAAASYRALATGLDRAAAADLAGAAAAYPVLLQAAGLSPDLEHCAGCGARDPEMLSGPAVLCSRCAPRGLRLRPEVLAVLRGQPCADLVTAHEVEAVVALLSEAHVGHALRSWRRPDWCR